MPSHQNSPLSTPISNCLLLINFFVPKYTKPQSTNNTERLTQPFTRPFTRPIMKAGPPNKAILMPWNIPSNKYSLFF